MLVIEQFFNHNYYMSNKTLKSKAMKHQLLLIIAIILVAAIVLPQFSAFSGSLSKITNLEVPLAGLSLFLIICTYFAGAGTYFFLAKKPLRYFLTVIVQFAAMFVNRILPAGIGAIGLNFGYLKRFGHSNIQSATIVGLNNLLGFFGNMLIIFAALVTSGISWPKNSAITINWLFLLIALPGLILLIYFMVNKKRRKKIVKSIKNIKSLLLAYADTPSVLIKAQLSSITLTLLHMLSLMLSMYAVGGSVSLAVVVVVFSFGVGVGSSVPTPGGLGGVEAGMVAGFVAFGMPANTALAGVLLYRLISFWLPLIIGGLAFIYVQKNGYIRFRNAR